MTRDETVGKNVNTFMSLQHRTRCQGKIIHSLKMNLYYKKNNKGKILCLHWLKKPARTLKLLSMPWRKAKLNWTSDFLKACCLLMSMQVIISFQTSSFNTHYYTHCTNSKVSNEQWRTRRKGENDSILLTITIKKGLWERKVNFKSTVHMWEESLVVSVKGELK